MRKTTLALLASTLLVSACGTVRDSRINPMNWFGPARSVEAAPAESTNPLIPQRRGLFARRAVEAETYEGRPFEQITDLTIEPVPGGAILRATGLATRQGIYAVRLTPATVDELPVDGVLTYRLEGIRPDKATRQGSQPTREVIAGRRLTDEDLIGVREIRVQGQLNTLVSRR
ncbi:MULTISPECIES: hypothetical protein [Sulfitobacter]|jgi:hypothetical protein|uniref:Lipoprotein n=1 Tax=Sulfitobacter dubius TaxID=218673 RepID=A0ABY3ZJP7_9RHOB|nr:hypothetical protein [Sulfitobacter dubius]UOA14899.1 hypothetical protein DSM109990_01714 [Sulfitobacter dubius]WOI29655.1 hypothetical protein R1T39_02810 [Sulfitobacter dubius]